VNNVLHPEQRKCVWPLHHGDNHYRYHLSGHAPTIPQPTVGLSWPRRTLSLPARRRGVVWEYLNTRFPGHWIGRAAPIAWPPRFSDLTPLDFFIWGFLEDRVFIPPLPASVIELRTRIIDAVAEVVPELIHSMWQDIDYRWDVCCNASGSHIEL
jgi:hypothetical protein